jgi:hypothetical protein
MKEKDKMKQETRAGYLHCQFILLNFLSVCDEFLYF